MWGEISACWACTLRPARGRRCHAEGCCSLHCAALAFLGTGKRCWPCWCDTILCLPAEAVHWHMIMDAQMVWGCSVLLKEGDPNRAERLNNAVGRLLHSPPCAMHT